MSSNAEIRIVIPGSPRPLERHRSRVVHSGARSFVQTYESATSKAAKNEIAGHALYAMRAAGHRTPIEGPLHLTLYFGIERPKSRPKSRPMPDSKPDFDNLAKLACDALNGLVWLDDSQVTDCVVKKRYDVNPRTEIVIRRLGVEELQFNRG